MPADCDIPDGHHIRESTRDPSFYGGVEQFTATPGQRRGLQFQLGSAAQRIVYVLSRWATAVGMWRCPAWQ